MLVRTLLSVPVNRPRMVKKAQHLPADVLGLDLEDSVPSGEKDNARSLVRDIIPGLAQREQKVFVRINSLASGLARDDLDAVVVPGLDGISQPKPPAAHDVMEIDAIITRLERVRGIPEGHVKMLPWVETARGLINAYEIASASPRVVGIIFGADDFALDTGMIRSEEGSELTYARTTVVIAAKADNVAAIDSPYNSFLDEEGLIKETMLIRQLGFEGKTLIHPSQIEPVNRIMQPSPQEIEYASRVVEAFEIAEAQGFASTSLNNKMIDIPIANRAKRLLQVAADIARREGMD